MSPHPEDLVRKLKLLPEAPGVYLMKGPRREIIYIGKAKVLKNRVKSYFSVGPKEHRAAALLAPLVVDIEWIITENELEALLLEARLVQKYLPRLNVRLKDGKRYPYLMMTTTEPFPRLVEVRRVADDGNRYFGPYTDARAMRQVAELIRRQFKIRSCRLKLPSQKEEHLCLEYHIGRCEGACVGLVTAEHYRKGVEQGLRLLSGKYSKLLEEMWLEMRIAAEQRRFEQAALIRDRIEAVEALGERQLTEWSGAQHDLDVMVLRREGRRGVLVLLEYREGALSGRKMIELRIPLEQSEEELLLNAVVALGGRAGARLVLLEKEPEDRSLLENWLTRHLGKRVRIAVPLRGKRVQFVRMAALNAEAEMERISLTAELEEQTPPSLSELQRLLGLPDLPQTVVGFDISHLGGTETVASMVVFEGGRPFKEGYRKFKIETASGGDDYRAMREVVGRRARRIIEEGLPWPDLWLIDGGEGQLSAAQSALEAVGAPEELRVVGLAERDEEIVLPSGGGRIALKRNHPALRLLQQIRDEAHRFALTFQRKRREKSLTVLQELEEIPGVGPAIRKKLFQKWGGVEKLSGLSREELATVVGGVKADRIVTFLGKKRGVSNRAEPQTE